MEDLNKNQIVLLTLLVSFVTSIATGIMTVSLLQEAPIEVTRNINRIVEKTIETVTTPSTIVSSPAQKEVTTVVVKEEDLIIDSINKNISSIVRIKEFDSVLATESFYGLGLVISKDGLITADRKTITSANTYTAVMSDGTEFKLNPTGVDKQTDALIFKAVIPPKSTDPKVVTADYSFVPAIFAEADPKLGQTVISLSGDKNNIVSVGRVSSLDMGESGTGTSTVKYLATVDTNLLPKDLISGSPVFNLSGDVVGMKITTLGVSNFTPVSLIKKDISTLVETEKAPTKSE